MKSVKEKDVLVNRSQMLQIARVFKIFVSQGTIHRWANEPEFPLVVGKRGKFLLYRKANYIKYLVEKKKKIQADH